MAATSSSVRVSTQTREAIARLATAHATTAGELLARLVAEAESADEEARRRATEFLKSSTTDDTIFDLEVLRTVRELAWPVRRR